MHSDYKVGQVIKGRYQILEALGEGGFATVFKARDKELGRDVAIKILKTNLSETDMERFRREAKCIEREWAS